MLTLICTHRQDPERPPQVLDSWDEWTWTPVPRTGPAASLTCPACRRVYPSGARRMRKLIEAGRRGELPPEIDLSML